MSKEENSPPVEGKVFGLTVNQVVSYNLSRARRSRGWTQEETAERLERASGKKWTAATLSASERAVKTGRPRIFDANELITFARVFEFPVAYFFLPIEPTGKAREEDFVYFLSRPSEADGRQVDPLLQMTDLLYASIPLKYPATVVDAVNRLLRGKGVVWQPYANVEWDDDGQSDFSHWQALNAGGETPEVSLDDWNTLVAFVKLSKKYPSKRMLRLLADAMDEVEPASSPPPDDEAPF